MAVTVVGAGVANEGRGDGLETPVLGGIIEGFAELLEATGLVEGKVATGDWTAETPFLAGFDQARFPPARRPLALRLRGLRQIHAQPLPSS